MLKQRLYKITKFLLWPTLLVVLLAFNASKQNQLVCSGLHVEVNNSQGVYFLTTKDVETKLLGRYPMLLGTPIKEIDIQAIEELLLEMPHVNRAKVYLGIDGGLTAKLSQKTPVARIAFQDGGGIYLDGSGNIMPLSKNFTARVLSVNGVVSRKWLKLKNVTEDSLLLNIYHLAGHIQQNEFLKAQLQQLYVNENQEFEFVPRVGNHIIEFGEVKNMEEKFENLQIFYQEGLAYKGWNRYDRISLKFKNQLVCTKK